MGKKWTGTDLYVREHMEGKFIEQTRVTTGGIDMTNGTLLVGKKSELREVHLLTFTKKKVEELLYGKHPFGKDSLNMTDPSRVVYYGKFDQNNL